MGFGASPLCEGGYWMLAGAARVPWLPPSQRLTGRRDWVCDVRHKARGFFGVQGLRQG